ncbi:hypothetical protein BDV96DRAFT_561480 [Lophiotrema nucula]|uniref:dual-specificity kinase n=1 Tax=Lophiotrema nucula TaxID=690887 RepID=A0A6A5ZX13_9PLEO|nr:hypothetical protein BDV96DRAFT_561480 [Lophiotrema nucula]
MTTQPARSGPARSMESALPVPRFDAAEDSSGSAGKLSGLVGGGISLAAYGGGDQDADCYAPAEGRVRRKFQRTTSGTDNKLRKSGASTVTSAPRPPPADNKTSFRGRRQSIRDHKVPLGPRPLDQAKQRVTSDASVASHASANRSFLPTSTSEPAFAPPPTRTANPRFSFGKQPVVRDVDTSGSYDFLPSVNFDDFHASISSYEPALSDFPAPGGGGGILPSAPGASKTGMGTETLTSTAETRPARSASLIRRFSNARKPNNTMANASSSNETPSMPPPPPATNMSIRTRRQSQFPTPTPSNPAARPPRKSVGPGMLPSDFNARNHEMPKPTNESTQSRVGRTPSFNQGNRPKTLSASLNTSTEPPKMPNTARSAKAKSFQPPPRQQSGFLSTSSGTPDPVGFPISQARSPARQTGQRTQTPSSSSSKRQSTMPHVGGLGARTISPTDARRLKRLSMNPNANPPSGPISPPTPQADFSFDDRPPDQSPALVFRTSVTPSSARGTPDQHRKSYASGISLSSNSSLNSLRPGNSTLQPRNPALSGSRLPTPKPRNVHSSAGEVEEEVPPVPAIPKAYESPKDPDHSQFSFSTSSAKPAPSAPSAPPALEREVADDVNGTNISNIEALGIDPAKTDPPKKSRTTIRHRRGLTVGAGSDAEKPPVVQHTNKKNLQPIRLPPLNLLPLGTPFNNRISSFPAPSAEVDQRNTTPPPKRASNKTPSTPMTASKASFFSKSNRQDHYDSSMQLRSSSSAFNLRPADSTLHAAAPMPIPTLNPPRQMTTPFASNSLPKGSGEFVRLYSRPSGEYKLDHTDVEMQSMKVNGPRALAKKEPPSSAHTSTSTDSGEPETPSSGSSLRRKLSLGGWRRTSSKASHISHPSQSHFTTQKANEKPPQPPNHGDMPPPRLPASATWSGSLGGSPTPSNRTRPSLDFSRRKPSTATVASDTEAEKSANNHRKNGSMNVRIPSGYTDAANGPPAPKSSSSILTPMQRMLGSKSSTNVLKSRNLDPNLDRDDLAADEEMRKLGTKRKDFESAARELDDLRKRARPQERVTAAQALQMVNLNIFERGEIIDYKEIYFCGTKNAKKHVGDLNAQSANFGYDDDRGDYNIVLGDHLAYRYEVVDVLGKGSFGQVVRCVDHKTGALMAIKIIRNKKRFHQQALVEVNILQKLREWASVEIATG